MNLSLASDVMLPGYGNLNKCFIFLDLILILSVHGKASYEVVIEPGREMQLPNS